MGFAWTRKPGCPYAVRAEGVWKSFGRHVALRGATLRAPWGSLTYLLGPNGAGKTTLVRTVLGLYRADQGVVETLCGRPRPGMAGIGYVPESADVYERLTGMEILAFYARIYSPRGWEVLVEEAVRVSGLSRSDLSRRAGEYSRGMRRRLLLAVALMARPRLLVLDEPFSGVDVMAAFKLKREVERLRSEGVTVVATSHNILEAERMADRVVFIHEGKTLYEGTVEGALRAFRAGDLEEAFVNAVGAQG